MSRANPLAFAAGRPCWKSWVLSSAGLCSAAVGQVDRADALGTLGSLVKKSPVLTEGPRASLEQTTRRDPGWRPDRKPGTLHAPDASRSVAKASENCLRITRSNSCQARQLRNQVLTQVNAMKDKPISIRLGVCGLEALERKLASHSDAMGATRNEAFCA